MGKLAVHPIIYRDNHEPRDKEVFLWLHTKSDGTRVLQEYNGSSWDTLFEEFHNQAAVLYDREQELSDNEKEQARLNIDALDDAPSDNVIYARKNGEWYVVPLSDVTKEYVDDEIARIEALIPDVTSFATKDELQEVEAEIPDISGLATKDELLAVEAEIPDVSTLATKSELSLKVDKISGKGLSTNDYTNTDKQKVTGAISDATFDGKTYGRMNGQWVEVESGGGSGEPAIYLKNAEVSNNGNTLTLTKKDNTAITFTPQGSGGSGNASWGNITGTITNQVDLIQYIQSLTSVFGDMFEKDTVTWPGHILIKAKYPLYSLGQICAGGFVSTGSSED